MSEPVIEKCFSAKLVWDGGPDVHVPEEMGAPAPGQLQGQTAERLAEVSGRICYDSLGKGRSSADYHAHIHEVRHFSVYEHPHLTVRLKNFRSLSLDFYATFYNRPGIFLRWDFEDLVVTFNPRSILDWELWSDPGSKAARIVGDMLSWRTEPFWPMIVPPKQRSPVQVEAHARECKLDEPVHDEERWISLFLAGSRGFSHEQVRHGDFTAISQRSTRYVDESESPWNDHPLIHQFMAECKEPALARLIQNRIVDVKGSAKFAYSSIVDVLQKWLIEKGVDKATARKQTRGAARGYLGNALYTELIFSASVGQWKRMLRMRCTKDADAEIRAIYTAALPELKRSRYGKDFAAFDLVPSKDGLGSVAVEAT